jgi:hypothetical protein
MSINRSVSFRNKPNYAAPPGASLGNKAAPAEE